LINVVRVGVLVLVICGSEQTAKVFPVTPRSKAALVKRSFFMNVLLSNKMVVERIVVAQAVKV
jgi:hypothetical protein